MGLFVNKFTTTLRVEGSNPGCSFFSFMGTPKHASIARRIIYFSGDEMTEDRENAGVARRRRTGRFSRNGYEKGFRFVTKMSKWWMPNKERHGEKILACCYISPVVHKPIHMKNENMNKTINIRSTCGVATLKKILNFKLLLFWKLITNFKTLSWTMMNPFHTPINFSS